MTSTRDACAHMGVLHGNNARQGKSEATKKCLWGLPQYGQSCRYDQKNNRIPKNPEESRKKISESPRIPKQLFGAFFGILIESHSLFSRFFVIPIESWFSFFVILIESRHKHKRYFRNPHIFPRSFFRILIESQVLKKSYLVFGEKIFNPPPHTHTQNYFFIVPFFLWCLFEVSTVLQT